MFDLTPKGSFLTGVYVTPQRAARRCLECDSFASSAVETEALQTALVACPRNQQRHNCNVPRLVMHRLLCCQFQECVQ
jgi:hypothetical protein